MIKNKKTILIIDDVPDNIDILDHYLNDKYSVKAATKGEIALKIINSQKLPDLILLDIMIPDISGYEIYYKLKSNIKTNRIPVIFISSVDEINSKNINIKDYDFLSKPVNQIELLNKIKKYLN